MSLVTLKTKVEQLIEKAQSGGGMTAGFTSEKYKQWLEINGYTIVNFTLTSQATANFDISHPLGRPAKSIVCFRADLDGSVAMDKICFAISVNGSIEDNRNNRLSKYESLYSGFIINGTSSLTDYRAILANTERYITLRYVADNSYNQLVWASGNYYLAVF